MKVKESMPPAHSERCGICKNKIYQILHQHYDCYPQFEHDFRLSARLEDYRGTRSYDALEKIYKALQEHRGYEKFVLAKTTRRNDLFFEKANVPVELDESQHFTAARRVTLLNYPANLRLGFSRTKWMKLCETIDAKDNDPVFRDEQRAWYDTLRDFLPWIRNTAPLVRICMRECRKTCLKCLSPDDPEDRAKLILIIKNKKFRSDM